MPDREHGTGPTPRLTIERPTGDHFVVSGEIDCSTSEELARALASVPVDIDVRVDMSDVDFMDSSGLRVLVETWIRHESAAHPVQILDPSRVVRRLIEISGLDDRIELIDPDEMLGPVER
jgi:anti-sigma B factor antagonist